MPQTTEVLKLPKPDQSTVERLKRHMTSSGYNLRDVRDAAVSGSAPDAVVTLYSTGRLVVQGTAAAAAMDGPWGATSADAHGHHQTGAQRTGPPHSRNPFGQRG